MAFLAPWFDEATGLQLVPAYHRLEVVALDFGRRTADLVVRAYVDEAAARAGKQPVGFRHVQVADEAFAAAFGQLRLAVRAAGYQALADDEGGRGRGEV